jgi:endogenous inhibitor of DNA gyrase (YacG/DUF329 family)
VTDRDDDKFLCPICKTEIDQTDPNANPLFPFCSERCKLIDLGRWLSGRYQVPVGENSRESFNDDRA